MNAPQPPPLRLLPQDVATFIQRGVFRASENAVGVRISRRHTVPHFIVFAIQLGAVPITLNGHRYGIGDERARGKAAELILSMATHLLTGCGQWSY